jgi:ferrous iron transport protein B
VELAEGRDAEIVVSEQRYAYIHGAASQTVQRREARQTVTELVDKILINRVLGVPIFLGLLWLIFELTFTIGAYPQAWLEAFFAWAGEGLRAVLPEGMLQSLLVDGIIGGVGGVFSFVPLVVILFTFISILEDTGYMARAAFIMDKFLHLFGLHGQSFMPMMLGFGCSVPAIMGARTLKSPKDRIITIMVIPFMSCGAKLPVYVLLAGAFFPAYAGTVVFSVYIVGVSLALLSALLLRHTVLKGPNTPFVLELPPYRLPTIKGIGLHVLDKAWQYLKKAGTVIMLASILIWAITSFPQLPPEPQQVVVEQLLDEQGMEAPSMMVASPEALVVFDEDASDDAMDGTQADSAALEYSIAGRIGKFIEPVFRPMGFDWKIAIATVTGFAAKEIVVSTLGILYQVGGEEDAESQPLREALQQDPIFNPLVAYVLMLFTLILAPCFATQATIKAELGWKWLGFYLGFSVLVAWVVSTGVYQIGRLLGLGV